ncbi:MAG: lysophospholipid acyltransferase family protein [Campylobacteraceae bacterium]|nr:lysophospholipid acyltransferase family protein [Campylobacteraceae bacterium]
MLKKETKRKILLCILPSIASFFLKLIYLTCRVKFHGSKFPTRNAIYACWHGELLMLPFCYMGLKNENQQISVMVSPHFDGQLISKTLDLIGSSENINGSSSRGGARALMGALKILKQENRSLAISPDGPRGPRHSVASGIVAISQKLKVPIVAVNAKAQNCWQFKSWDKMFLPKPFSKLDFFVSEPFYLDGLELEVAKEKVKNELMKHASK